MLSDMNMGHPRLTRQQYLKGMKEGTLTEGQIADYQVPGPLLIHQLSQAHPGGFNMGRSRVVNPYKYDVANHNHCHKKERIFHRLKSGIGGHWIKFTWLLYWLRGATIWAHVSL